MEEWKVGDKATITHLPNYIHGKPIVIHCTIVKVGDPKGERVRVDTDLQKNVVAYIKDLKRAD